MASQGNAPPATHPQPLQPPPPDWQPPSRRKSRIGKATAMLIVVLLLLYILFYTPIGTLLFSGITGNSYAESSEFTLNRVITIDADSEINYLCDIPIPQSLSYPGNDFQAVSGTTYSPTGELFEKFDGDWIEWNGTVSGRMTLSITTQASVKTVIWDIGSKNSGMASDIPDTYLESQTGDEWETLDAEGEPSGEYRIWPSHGTIIDLAESLTSDDLTVYDNAKRIYSYIRENIEYRTVSGSEAKPCLRTLRDGTGDCDDQSILLISLLRSAGIPSWLVLGTLYDTVLGEWGAHAWVELYIPLKEGGGETVVIDPANGEFLVRNCNRLEDWKSDGDGLHLADYYNILSYNYSVIPGHPAPVVSVTDSYHGEYQVSAERVYASIFTLLSCRPIEFFRESRCGFPVSQKAF